MAKGRQGEAFVGWLLGRLPDGWSVFSDIEVGTGDANIDHLAIGPGGVVTVNTKNLGGKVWVAPRALLHNGRKTNYLPKAAREAERAGALVGQPWDSRLMCAELSRSSPTSSW